MGIVTKALWKSYNVKKANMALQLGIQDDIDVYLARSGLNDEKHVLRAMRLRRRCHNCTCRVDIDCGTICCICLAQKQKSIQFIVLYVKVYKE